MRIELQLTHPTWRSLETPLGLLRWRGHPDSVEALSSAFAEVLTSPHDSAFTEVAGHWCAVFEHIDGMILAQDRLRSWPLFIAEDPGGRLTVTDDIDAARIAAGAQGRDENAAFEFLHLGYVTGADTLFAGVSQLQAGEWRSLGRDTQNVASGMLPVLRHADPGVIEPAQLDADFGAALDAVLDRLLSRIGDRQVVIPLSGGLDSRLLATAMHDRGHDRVLNFTYGIGRTREVGISEQVAASLGQPWEFVQYTVDEIRGAWASPEAGEFIRASYAGASLPHIQDWYAVAQLRARGLLDDNAVFLPGHMVVGNMHDEAALLDPAPMPRSQLTQLILHHHASIRPHGDALLSSPRFLAKLDAFYDRMRYEGTPLDRLDAMEGWNILERQTKYINNSVRTYEHFGYEWELPLLDREMFETWETFGLPIAQDREWYRRYVNRRYAAATGDEANTFEPFVAANVSQSNRERMKSVLRALGLLQRIERGITARAVANHPMGYQAYVGETSSDELRRFIMRGGNQMGIYTERFLDDSWNPHAQVFG